MKSYIRLALGLGIGVVSFSAALACGDDKTATPAATTQVPTVTATSTEATQSPTTEVTEPTSGGTTVSMANFAFNPETITVPVGSTVTWTNADSAPHRPVSTTAGGFNAGTAKQGESVQATFDTAGEFPYICEIHPSMKGTVIVQ